MECYKFLMLLVGVKCDHMTSLDLEMSGFALPATWRKHQQDLRTTIAVVAQNHLHIKNAMSMVYIQ